MEETLKPRGKLFLNNKLFKENVELFFEDKHNDNKQFIGCFKIDYLNADYLNNFGLKKQKFKYIDEDNTFYFGIITGWEEKTKIYSKGYYLKFQLIKKQQYVKYSKDIVNKIKITYSIPYCYFLGRDILQSYGFDNNYLIKFRKPPLICSLNDVKVEFNDIVHFKDIQYKIGETKRYIVPTILLILRNKKNLIELLNNYEKIMTETMIILSFYFNHKMDWYSYHAEI